MPTPKGIQAKLKTVDGESLLPDVVSAALGAKTFKQASKPLSEDQRALLSRAIKMDVDEFRAEFASQLRSTGSLLLQQLQERANELKPDAIAYSLAVVIDKASAMDGRTALHNSSINVIVNNFGSPSKDSLLAELDGISSIKRASPINPSDPEPITLTPPNPNDPSAPTSSDSYSATLNHSRSPQPNLE